MPDAADLRRPLSRDELARGEDTIWTALELVERTPSTNADLVARARASAAHGLLLVTEEQTAGRGRHDRTWNAPARSSVMVSALLRPRQDPATWGWVPLLTAVAVAETVQWAGADCTIKWPNDVLVADRKVAGILCEVVPGGVGGAAVVAGWGLNVSQTAAELPAGTSLLLAGARTDRAALLRHALGRWSHWFRRWDDGDGGGVRQAYEARSSTLGRRVEAHLPGGTTLEGVATAVAETGALVVHADGRDVVVAAGDVVHLRAVLPP